MLKIFQISFLAGFHKGPRQEEDAKSESDQVYWTCHGYIPRGEMLVNQGINYMTNESTPSNEIVLETWALPITVFLVVLAYIRNVYYKIYMTVFFNIIQKGGSNPCFHSFLRSMSYILQS